MPEILTDRVTRLSENLEACLASFERNSQFAGHTASSHRDTLEFVRRAARPTDVLDDAGWYSSLLRTLADWNMDQRGAQLLPLVTVRSSFRALRPQLAELEVTRLETLSPYYSILSEQKLWAVIDNLTVGQQGTRLVVNTKAVHHLLPDLVPPMDRTYTFWFFYDFPNIPNFRPEKKTFSEVWSQFIKIARAIAPIAPNYLGQSMHTSTPKMADNAIIG